MPKAGGRVYPITPMGQAVWWVLQQMIHQPQNRKILLIITDGVPDSHANAAKAFDMAKALNIEVHGIGIGYCHLRSGKV